MTTDQPTDPRVAFRRGALDAIPYNLIDSPAVGVGDARRYMLADAMWPVAEPLLAAAYDRGLAKGRRQVDTPCEACQAPMTLTACLSCVTREALERGRAEGIAEGRRQATEGWEREWLIETPQWWTSTVAETDARQLHARHGGKLTSRLVGPWEPAEQTDPLAGDPARPSRCRAAGHRRAASTTPVRSSRSRTSTSRETTVADDVTPAQTAGFDQAHAEIGAYLDAMIDVYRSQLADGRNPGLSMAGMAEWVAQTQTLPAAADLLAVAVARLVEQGEGGAR